MIVKINPEKIQLYEKEKTSSWIENYDGGGA